jgi:hypothetical protein
MRSADSSIDILPVSNPDHDDEQLPVSDEVDDPIPAHSYPISLAADALMRTL